MWHPPSSDAPGCSDCSCMYMRVTQYIQLQSLTSHCAFLFIHRNISFQHRHCHTFASTFHTFTPSNVLFHPFMLNLLFAYPIYLINTNVGPTTHPYYTKFKALLLKKLDNMLKLTKPLPLKLIHFHTKLRKSEASTYKQGKSPVNHYKMVSPNCYFT